MNVVLGIIIWSFLILTFYNCRPKSKIYNISVANAKTREIIISLTIMLVAIIVCLYPMSLNPIWNGEIPKHRNQYEVMTEAILDGKIYIEYDEYDAKDLEKLENPYDPVERMQSKVKYKWDHAYYNGNYYMYFGIVPVILLFLPFKLITGITLLSYQATQIFTALIILGIFTLFYMLSKRFFDTIPFYVYTFLATAFSCGSVWYFSTAPALYCVALSSAVCFQLWSIFFFIKAVWIEQKENKQIAYAFIGSLLGALVFGCRPSVALANLLVIPMLIIFLKQKIFSFKLFLKLVVAAIPYFVIGILLMCYNYARFDNPFEFGQAYQLTVADQTQYASMTLAEIDWIDKILRIGASFIYFKGFSNEFPYIQYNGILLNFPIYLMMLVFFKQTVQSNLKRSGLRFFMYILIGLSLIISIVQILWSPSILERYHSDIYFLLFIACFLLLGFWLVSVDDKKKKTLQAIVMYMAIATTISSFLLFCVPNDSNLVQYFPDTIDKIKHILLFWIYI